MIPIVRSWPARRNSATAHDRVVHRYTTAKLFGGLNRPPWIRGPSPTHGKVPAYGHMTKGLPPHIDVGVRWTHARRARSRHAVTPSANANSTPITLRYSPRSIRSRGFS